MSSLENLSFEQRDELAILSKTLADNPETRKDFLRLTKKVNPEMVIPELQLEEYTERKVSAAEEKVMALENKLREKEIREQLESKRRALKERGIAQSDQDVQEIEKIMLEQGITSHDTAAQHWEWMKQAAVPTPTGYNPNTINKFDLSKYWKNPQGAARDVAASALHELRNQGRKPIGI
jgi:hypothetical protein